MLKLIFSDLDDTLLDSKKTVSNKIMNFIKELKGWSKKLSSTLKPSKEIGEFTLGITVLIVWLTLFLCVEFTFIGTIHI